MSKRKIAIVDLTGCTGCEVNLLNLNEQLLDLFQEFEVSNWRMVQDDYESSFDIVFVEGFVCNEEQEEVLRQVRAACDVLVAMGACAVSGNIFSLLTKDKYEWCTKRVYGTEHNATTKFVRPVSDVVTVDHLLPGCPVKLDAVTKLLAAYRDVAPRLRPHKPRTPDLVAKIEGHGSLQVDFERRTANFIPEEGERFVEALVVGKKWKQALNFYARICGICPVSHVLAAIFALEKALHVQPSTTVNLLRRLYVCAQIIHSHLLHLYFMILPSPTGRSSAIRMSLDFPAEFHAYLTIKRICEHIFKVVGGSTLHPATLIVGGFSRVAESEELFAIQHEITETLDEAIDLVRLFASFSWPTARSGATCIAIRPGVKDEYPLLGSRILGDGIAPFPVGKYREFLVEEIVVDSPSKTGRLIPERPIKTGALARIHHYGDRLAPLAQRELENSNYEPVNPYYNVPAQAIEILHFMEEAINLIDRLVNEDLQSTVVRTDLCKDSLANNPKDAYPLRGVGAIEAPRGILIHEIALDNNGLVTECNILPPTALNLSGLATETEGVLADNVSEDRQQKKMLLTELIRAMDPCITCAVH